jgi:hypothetical protein
VRAVGKAIGDVYRADCTKKTTCGQTDLDAVLVSRSHVFARALVVYGFGLADEAGEAAGVLDAGEEAGGA